MDRDVNDTGVRKHIGYLPENPYFYDYLTAEELLWFGGKTTGLSSQTIKKRSDELFEKVNLQNARKRQLRTYSKGMVQRAGLALSLIHDPDVAILDEPMSGLDPLGRKMVGDILLELKSRGKTIFFSSHILTDVERFCDKVGIIVAGRLRLAGGLNDLLTGNADLEEVFMKEIEQLQLGPCRRYVGNLQVLHDRTQQVGKRRRRIKDIRRLRALVQLREDCTQNCRLE